MSEYYGPVPLWWWSGAPLEPERLTWQLDRLMDGGVRQAVVISLAPAGPLWGCPADEPEFMSDAWWEIFLEVCAHAADRGFGLWLYDQLGFSGANLQGRVVAANPWARGMRLDRGGPVASGFDYLNPNACALLFDTVHGELERRAGAYFGSVIKGTFQDELPTMPSWSGAFAEEFARRRGYRLEPHLDALWEEPGPVRRDYQLTRAELAEQAFFRPLHDWHAKRGLLVGCDQQEPARGGHAVAGVRYYADYARTHRWFSAPGSDQWGDGKRHSSLAHTYGHGRVWIEAFHSTGWGGTLEETLDWLIPWVRAGANLYNPHAVYYSTQEGRFEWAPPSTCWRQPYWTHYRSFAEVVAKLCAAAAEGTHVCDVAVLDPATTVQQELPPFTDEHDVYLDQGDWPEAHHVYRDLVGVMSWHDFRPGLLDRLGIDFDVLDEPSIQRAGPTLELEGERYRTVILPAARALEPATARVLAAFAESGGQVIAVGSLPESAAGLGDDPAEVLRLRDLVVACANISEAQAVLAAMPRRVEAKVPTLLRRAPDGSHLLIVPAAFPMATRAGLEGYTFQPAELGSTTVTVPGEFLAAEGVPLTGDEPRPLEVRREDDRLRITVPFDEAPVALVRLGRGSTPRAPLTGTVQSVDGPWTAEPVQVLDNRHGDFPRIADAGLQIWRMERLDHLGAWRPARASFGEWAERDGTPVSYSETWGSGDQPAPFLHENKGYVPEEFVAVGRMSAGETVTLRAAVDLPHAGDYVLVVGAPAAKRILLDGTELPAPDGYHAECPVALQAGRHHMEIRLTALTDETVGASYTFVPATDWRPRPQWLSAGPTLHLTGAARILLATIGPVTLRLDGKELVRHGEFDNYAWLRMPRAATYEADPGTLTAELGDAGCRVLIDALLPDGSHVVTTADLGAVDHRTYFDQTVLATEPRPHPLRSAALPVPLEPRAAEERLRLRLPPGSIEVTVPSRTLCRAWYRGAELPGPGPFRLDDPARGGDELELSLETATRWSGGALLTGPVTVRTTSGPVELGDWGTVGLGDFSGALVYRTIVTMPRAAAARLRLGEVRGTAEVRGAGARLWSPYTFDLSLVAGDNPIEIIVRNTLAPYLSAVNPHVSVLPGQERSGLFGPVTLEVLD